METSEQINCPAPLPKDPADALLTEMRTPAPYEVLENTKKAKATRKSSWRQVVLDSSSESTEVHSSHENEEEEEESSLPPAGGDKKRKVAPLGEAEGSKKGRTLLPDCSTVATFSDEEWLPRDKPHNSSSYVLFYYFLSCRT